MPNFSHKISFGMVMFCIRPHIARILFMLLLVSPSIGHAEPKSMPLSIDNIRTYLISVDAAAHAEGYKDTREFMNSIALDRTPGRTIEQMMHVKSEKTRRILVDTMERMGYDYQATVRAAAGEMFDISDEMKEASTSSQRDAILQRAFAVSAIPSIAEEMSGFLLRFGIISEDTANLLKKAIRGPASNKGFEGTR
ncbi:MAG: hypothetical protein GY721_06205 [Deltaproteobacteria bacterium]|nr:hypothetical protein [Deltaproteobacteria bacterium]